MWQQVECWCVCSVVDDVLWITRCNEVHW